MKATCAALDPQMLGSLTQRPPTLESPLTPSLGPFQLLLTHGVWEMTSDLTLPCGPPLAAWTLAGVKPFLPLGAEPPPPVAAPRTHLPTMSSTPGPRSGPPLGSDLHLSPLRCSSPAQHMELGDDLPASDLQAQSNLQRPDSPRCPAGNRASVLCMTKGEGCPPPPARLAGPQ